MVQDEEARTPPPNHDYDIDKLQSTSPAEPEQLARAILTTPPKPQGD